MRKAGINWLSIFVDDKGVVTPEKLNEHDKAKPKQAITAAALIQVGGCGLKLVDAPAPKRIDRDYAASSVNGGSADGLEVSTIPLIPEVRYVVFPLIHSYTVENWFSQMRGNSLAIHVGAVGLKGRIACSWSTATANTVQEERREYRPNLNCQCGTGTMTVPVLVVLVVVVVVVLQVLLVHLVLLGY